MLFAQLLLFQSQFSFQSRELAVPELRHSIEVIGALGLINLQFDLFDSFAHLAEPSDGGFLRFPLGFQDLQVALLFVQLCFEGAQPSSARLVFFFLQRFPLNFQLEHLARDFVQLCGQAVDLGSKACGGLIDQVDGLIRKEAICNVAMRQLRRGDQRAVFDPDSMVDFITFLETPQNGNGVFHGGLIDQNSLKAALQGRIFFDMFPVLVERGCPDQVQFSPGQHRLQQISRVHRAFGGAGSHDRMQFIDEEKNLALRGLNLLQDGLESFLELAAKFGSGDERAHVQCEEFLVLETVGDIAFDDADGQSFHDRGFADSRFADEHGIILRSAGEDLHHASDFVVSTDHGIEFALSG